LGIALHDDDAYGALSVFAQAAFRVARVRKVPPGAFVPAPRVHSAVVALEPRPDAIEETAAFRKVVSAAFGARRKTLRNAWAGLAPRELLEAMAAAAGTTLDARGEILTADAFARAARVLEVGAPPAREDEAASPSMTGERTAVEGDRTRSVGAG
jgi:16S rRNA (adenine1518-N6/adenine1519-N6)-dimethyltransferase